MSKPSIPEPRVPLEQVLAALSSIVVSYGHSLSWYTSKKGRIWITLKGFSPIQYTTSAECDPHGTEKGTWDTFIVLMYCHYPKLFQEEPPLPTWLTMKAVSDMYDEAYAWLDTLNNHLDPATGELKDAPPDPTLDAIE
jgi:hypothetical protein